MDTTAGILSGFNYDIYTAGRLIELGEAPGILLEHGSTGISTIGLLVGCITIYPDRWIPRVSFLITGLGVIYIVDIISVTVLTITQVHCSGLFVFTHNSVTTVILYLVAIALWIMWVNTKDRG